MSTRKSSWRVLGLVAAVLALFMMTMAGAYSAPGGIKGPPEGVGGGGGGGGGGGHEPPTEETSKSLSVPAVFVPNTGSFSLTCDGTTTAPANVATNTTSVFPDAFTPPLMTQDDGTATPLGPYYVQGEDTWQAGCAVAETGTLAASATFGDNIDGGDAAFKVGSPVRVEVGLTIPTTGYTLAGYTVYKLTNELDRVATYGTQGSAISPYPELRVWAADAQFKIDGPAPVPLQTMVAEINSTGRVVYGYNWRPSQEGVYTITFSAPSVGVTTATAVVDVAASAGGGGGGGHGGGGGGPH